MRILEYNDLDTSGVGPRYQKLIEFLERDDFHSAEVKKLKEHGLYRAKLDDSNRLLFKILTYEGARYALILEVVRNHAYDKSKFLRGVRIDESKIPTVDVSHVEKEDLPSLVYLNPSIGRFHLLDKIISFDPDQDEIYRLPPPLIVIGPAGSGKTALTLEKMKSAKGRVLYVTLSRYLADNTRDIYYSNHYENDGQEISFLSFGEFLETMRIPEGREVTYSAFVKWLLRFPRRQRVSDAHRLYEEFRSVITGSVFDKPWLSREDYLSLGVKQSIFINAERGHVYDLFEKYLGFLKENRYYDPNIIAHDYLRHVSPDFDMVVADEVQDITNVQLKLILRSLKNPANFVLCGDSNQIVYPNFFSWSKLKSMLYNSDSLDTHKVTRVLRSNFRNSASITDIANMLLRAKQRRFGSIDRESNYLMNSVSKDAGEIVFMKDSDRAKRDINRNIRRSTRFAVLVMRDEDKPGAREFFDTPLIFSIHEAKGLEYENVILVNFISSERSSFEEIIRGIDPTDLHGNFEYRRSRDKSDKSLEVYKFFVNSLYVAVTRAVKRLYLIESDTDHPLIRVLGIGGAREVIEVEAKASSIEEWQAEARRLEQQGRQEQAEEIRREILKKQPVPWDVCAAERVLELLGRVCNPREISKKPGKTLFEYALFHSEKRLLKTLSTYGFGMARQLFFEDRGNYPSISDNLNNALYEQQMVNLIGRYLQRYSGRFFRDILRECEIYGVDHRNIFNKTPLMMAALAGNAPLARELLGAGADAELTDNYGITAWTGALQRALEDRKFAVESFVDVHELLAPSAVSLKVEDRLIKIDAQQGEFLLFYIFFATFRGRINEWYLYSSAPLTASAIEKMVSTLPESVISEYRKARSYISGLLSKNEAHSANPYSRKLFKRKRWGNYILNPDIAIRQKEDWIDIYSYANIELIAATGERCDEKFRSEIRALLSKTDGE